MAASVVIRPELRRPPSLRLHMNTFADLVSRLLRLALRLVFALAATVFLVSLMLASLVVVLAVSLWSLLLWMFSLTAQADCAVLGPGEDPCAGPVLGPTVCECP